MGDVIEFPIQSARDQTEVERAIREVLEDGGLRNHDIESIVANMQDFLALLPFDFAFKVSAAQADDGIDEELQRLGAEIQHRTARLVQERLKAEVAALCRSRSAE